MMCIRKLKIALLLTFLSLLAENSAQPNKGQFPFSFTYDAENGKLVWLKKNPSYPYSAAGLTLEARQRKFNEDGRLVYGAWKQLWGKTTDSFMFLFSKKNSESLCAEYEFRTTTNGQLRAFEQHAIILSAPEPKLSPKVRMEVTSIWTTFLPRARFQNAVSNANSRVIQMEISWTSQLSYWTDKAHIQQETVLPWIRLDKCQLIFAPGTAPPQPEIDDNTGRIIRFHELYAKHGCSFWFGIYFEIRSREDSNCFRQYTTTEAENLKIELDCKNLNDVDCWMAPPPLANENCKMSCDPQLFKSEYNSSDYDASASAPYEYLMLHWTFPTFLMQNTRAYLLRHSQVTLNSKYEMQAESFVQLSQLKNNVTQYRIGPVQSGRLVNFSVQLCAVTSDPVQCTEIRWWPQQRRYLAQFRSQRKLIPKPADRGRFGSAAVSRQKDRPIGASIGRNFADKSKIVAWKMLCLSVILCLVVRGVV